MSDVVRVCELAEQLRGVSYGKRDASSTPRPGYLPVLRAGNITEDGLTFDDLVFVPAEHVSAKQKIRRNDIVIAASSGSLDVVGKAARALDDYEGGFGAFCKILRPGPDVDPAYFAHFFRTKQYRQRVSALAAGVNINNLRNEHLDEIQIPIPSLRMQRWIAEILDKADALRAKRREALAQLDTLLQSTFLDMFGDPVDNPMGLRRESLKSAFEFTTGKLDSNAAVEGGKYPFFTCARETSAIDDYAFDCEALLLAGNNANADYSVKHYKGRFNAYQRTYVITIKESALTYAYARLVLEYLLGDLKRFSKGTNTKYLTMVILNRMPILVPPLDLQRRFAAVVESIEEQKARQRAHLAELDTLFASLQSRAFRGEL